MTAIFSQQCDDLMQQVANDTGLTIHKGEGGTIEPQTKRGILEEKGWSTVATKTKKRPAKASKSRKPIKSKIGTIEGSGDDPNQTYIDGTEPLKIPKLDAQVARYDDLTRSRKSAKEHADEVLTDVVAIMKENGITTYRSNGKIVTIVEGQTVCKIKKASDK